MEGFLEDRSTAGEQLEESWKTGEQSWSFVSDLVLLQRLRVCLRFGVCWRFGI